MVGFHHAAAYFEEENVMINLYLWIVIEESLVFYDEQEQSFIMGRRSNL